jgi:chromosome condensin MukBEF ATPase and DNA-binding subunit MukB
MIKIITTKRWKATQKEIERLRSENDTLRGQFIVLNNVHNRLHKLYDVCVQEIESLNKALRKSEHDKNVACKKLEGKRNEAHGK